MDTMTAEQAIEAAKGLTFEAVWAAMMKTDARLEETAKQMRESQERTDNMLARTEKVVADLSKNIGGLGLSRIEKIRQYMDKHGDARKIVGAVAGGVISDNVMRYAQKRGLFVIAQTGGAAAIAGAPDGFKARVW